MPLVTTQDPLYSPCPHQQEHILARNTALGAAEVSLMLRDKASEGFKALADANSTERLLTLKVHYDRWLHIIGAFGVELGLKGCLQQAGCFDRGNHYTHDLWVLYSGLPRDIRTALTLRFRERSGGDGLPGILKRHRHDFRDWRYLDEDPADSSDMNAETYTKIIDTLVDWMDGYLTCSCPARPLDSIARYEQLVQELRA